MMPKAGLYWEQNAKAWTRLCRQGYDVYRDRLLRNARCEAYAVEVSRYFEDTDGRIDQWLDTRVGAYFLQVRARKGIVCN